jgi:Icc-related predicted phosphoesterase
MTRCVFVTDLHGKEDRYRKLFRIIETERPAAVFMGGDLFPHQAERTGMFGEDILVGGFNGLKETLGAAYPRVFLILGNDDPRVLEEKIFDGDRAGLWHYLHNSERDLAGFPVIGYSFVPPTPFRLKDWERYDVSRFTDPGCIPPEEGRHSVSVADDEVRRRTIEMDLNDLTGADDLSNAIFLFHTPPYDTKLDLAALGGKSIDHAPLDPHVGSIAVRRMIERCHPLVTLHGHVHESARLSGSWKDRIGKTLMFSAAHDGPELAVVRFAPERPDDATRELE